MKTQHFWVKRDYDITCKSYFPDDERVNSVIIGVHGFAGDKDSSMLVRLAEDVCQRGTALICFDFPAHGESPVGEEMLTVENCKRDFCAIVDYVAENYPEARKSVFATSFGGFIALLCAESLGDFTFILRAPAVTMPKVLIDNVLKITAEEFKQSGRVECGFERKISLPYSFYEEAKEQEKSLGKKISSPILVIHGDLDDIVPLADVRDFVTAQENARLEIIRGADHRFKNAGEIERIIALTTSCLGL